MIGVSPNTMTICIPLTVTRQQSRNCRAHDWRLWKTNTVYSIAPWIYRTETCACGAVRYVPVLS
jgi:hypothetical protein